MSDKQYAASEWDDALWAVLHELIGYCGHCGRKKCEGKKKYSRLPPMLSTDVLNDAVNEARRRMKAAQP